MKFQKLHGNGFLTADIFSEKINYCKFELEFPDAL